MRVRAVLFSEPALRGRPLSQAQGAPPSRLSPLSIAIVLTALSLSTGVAHAAGKPKLHLTSISVLPASVKLTGPRAEQGLVVTGRYSDGSARDLTATARLTPRGARVVTVSSEEDRRVLRPVADGRASVTVSVSGAAAVSVPVVVRGASAPQPISFRAEVIPALTKAGCNQGVCHGTPTGKGGFRLSLQGYAPELDYDTLVHEGGGRRTNRADPGRSLILLKPMVAMPHGGGKRLSPEMPEFRVLTRWIGEGLREDPPSASKLAKLELLPGDRILTLPGARQQVVVMATFSDGTVRDVTSLTKLSVSDDDVATISREGVVEGRKRGQVAVMARYQDALKSVRLTFIRDVPGFRWGNPTPFNAIDRAVFARLKLFQIPVSPLADDHEFLRRAYLDTLGLLPTAGEARAFLADKGPDKRSRLIRALTERPEFADFWALKWSDVLRIQDETLKKEGVRAFHDWVRQSIAADKPMDRFARELLTASGPTFENAPANYYRAIQDPEQLTQGTAQLFLGVRIGCARCHNHPYDRWTQDEYYEFGAFFAQVRLKDGPQKEEQTVYLDPGGQVVQPRTGKTMRPKLLGGPFAKVSEGQDRRAALADWLTRKDNPFFARAMVNRIWENLLGRGIVEPIDDFRASNPAVNDALLDVLTRGFVAHGYDFKYLVRTIMESRTYQLAALPVPLNKDDHDYFSHAVTRVLTAEQLSDAITRVTGVPEHFEGYPMGTRAVQMAGTEARTPFLKVFGRPDRNLTCECEREKEPTLFQALALISGRSVAGRIADDHGRLATLAASKKSDEEVLDELYLSALTRAPSPKERAAWLAYFAKSGNRRQALEDLAWVLINSKEFLFRH